MFAGERETGQGMVKGGQCSLGGIEITAFVFLVAGSAGTRLVQATVHTIALCNLGVNVLVALQTLGGLIGLEWHVAVPALRFKFSMRLEVAQHNPWLVVVDSVVVLQLKLWTLWTTHYV